MLVKVISIKLYHYAERKLIWGRARRDHDPPISTLGVQPEIKNFHTWRQPQSPRRAISCFWIENKREILVGSCTQADTAGSISAAKGTRGCGPWSIAISSGIRKLKGAKSTRETSQHCLANIFCQLLACQCSS